MIDKNFCDSLALEELEFFVFVDEKDIHYLDSADSSEISTQWVAKKAYWDRVKISLLTPLSYRELFETMIANPQSLWSDPTYLSSLKTAKFYNAKDMINFYMMPKGIKCIGAIENNEENEADGHLRFARFMNEKIEELSDTMFDKTIGAYLSPTKSVKIETVKLVPSTLSYFREHSVISIEQMPNGLYFFLDGAILVADAPSDEQIIK